MKMKYLIKGGSGDWENEIPHQRRLRFVPLTDRAMKYLIKGDSGLYPYPDWAMIKGGA